jgi:hypothetical protein
LYLLDPTLQGGDYGVLSVQKNDSFRRELNKGSLFILKI